MNNTTSLSDTFFIETFLWIIPTAFLIVFFALGALMWEMPVNNYELVTEPLYRLKQ